MVTIQDLKNCMETAPIEIDVAPCLQSACDALTTQQQSALIMDIIRAGNVAADKNGMLFALRGSYALFSLDVIWDAYLRIAADRPAPVGDDFITPFYEANPDFIQLFHRLFILAVAFETK